MQHEPEHGRRAAGAVVTPSVEDAGHAPCAGAARPDWIAVDWGTSALRVWAMADDGTVLGRGRSDQGMGGLDPDGFEPALLALIGGWLPARGTVPVIACGMVGARQGWAEAGYRPVPCAPLALPLTVPPVSDSRIRVAIVPGLSQLRPSADVMRGEETQIAGVMALEPGWDGVVCLPGTHSKWAEISAGEVVSFRSFMTGELFALLSTRSVLRHGLAGSGDDDEAAFDAAVLDGAARPEALAARLFTLRAEALLAGLPAAAARARLSGLLIGAELVAARPWWLGRDVLIVGDDAMAGRYGRALSAMGVMARTLPAERAVLAGLSRARALAAKERA